MSERQQNILIVDAGGRGSALGWKLHQSHNNNLYFAPGNGGTEQIGKNVPIEVGDAENLARFSRDNNIDLAVIGPEKALQAGVSDALNEAGINVFGPSKKASRIETSKALGIRLMQAYDIPHPRSWVYSNPAEAIAKIESLDFEIVVKASGLAGGKGVFLPDTLDEAVAKIHAISNGDVSGIKGDEIIIQKRLKGRELSVIAFSDGKTVVPLVLAQDYKRALDQDKGPNTGGMGSFAPSDISFELRDEIEEKILKRMITKLGENGMPFVGAIYAGLILEEKYSRLNPNVIEFNARFGDPETQAQMAMLSSDLGKIMTACINGNLTKDLVKFKKGASVCVVLAENGYPGEVKPGHVIHGLDTATRVPDIEVFHAGTEKIGNQVLTTGGRVAGVTAYGKDLAHARRKAYSAIGGEGVWFEGMQYRKDIGE